MFRNINPANVLDESRSSLLFSCAKKGRDIIKIKNV
jgi:hypothetical protein